MIYRWMVIGKSLYISYSLERCVIGQISRWTVYPASQKKPPVCFLASGGVLSLSLLLIQHSSPCRVRFSVQQEDVDGLSLSS